MRGNRKSDAAVKHSRWVPHRTLSPPLADRKLHVRRDAVGDGVGQNNLYYVKMGISEKRIALIDKIEHCADDQRDDEGAPGYAV